MIEVVGEVKTKVDFEEKYLSEKRTKQAVRRLVYLNWSRLLSILEFTSSENDMKRLEYSINMFGDEYVRQRYSREMITGSGGNSTSLFDFFGVQNA